MTIDRIAEPPRLLVQPPPPLPAPASGSLWNDYLPRLLGAAHGGGTGGATVNDDDSDPEPACCCAIG